MSNQSYSSIRTGAARRNAQAMRMAADAIHSFDRTKHNSHTVVSMTPQKLSVATPFVQYVALGAVAWTSFDGAHFTKQPQISHRETKKVLASA